MTQWDPKSLTQADFDRAQNWVWTTRDGTKMRLGDMTDAHLRNLNSHVIRRLKGCEEAHEQAFLRVFDSKNRTSFSGQENAIETMQKAIRMISAEISRRANKSTRTTKTPA